MPSNRNIFRHNYSTEEAYLNVNIKMFIKMIHDLLIVFRWDFGVECSLISTEFENKPKI